MKKLFLLLIVSILFANKSYCAYSRTTKNRVLLVALILFSCSNTYSQNYINKKTLNEILINEIKKLDVNNLVIGLRIGNKDSIIYYGNNCSSSKLFEMGSISKVFTGLVFHDLVKFNKLKIYDTIALPLNSINSKYKFRYIDLITHTSGLPTNPTNIDTIDDPTIGYNIREFTYFLNNYNFNPRKISRFEYSNTGVMLLSLCIEYQTKKSIITLLENKISSIGLMNTTLINHRLLNNLSKGYSQENILQNNWDFNYFTSAGGIHSNSTDMFVFLNYLQTLYYKDKSFFKTNFQNEDIEIATLLFKDNSYKHTIFWHNGGTNGYSSHISFSPNIKNGFFILSDKDIDFDELVIKLNSMLYD